MSSQNAQNAMMSAQALNEQQRQIMEMMELNARQNAAMYNPTTDALSQQKMAVMGAQNSILSTTATKRVPDYGLSPEQAEKCKHMTVYYIAQPSEGSVVKEAKFPLSVFSDDSFTMNYRSMTYPYPAFETRDAAEEYIRNQARMLFRGSADALFKKLTDLIFKRGCTGDSETKLLNDMQDYLREDK